jgi:2-iminobutanoate/2-iminopropanoate deaminase
VARKHRVRAPEAPEPRERLWSNCLRVGDMVYFAGLTARSADQVTIEGANAYEQARIIFGKIRALVQAAGGRMDDVVQLTIYVTDMRDNSDVWRARAEVFSGDFPACALVQVAALATPAIRVEISAIAHLGCTGD